MLTPLLNAALSATLTRIGLPEADASGFDPLLLASSFATPGAQPVPSPDVAPMPIVSSPPSNAPSDALVAFLESIDSPVQASVPGAPDVARFSTLTIADNPELEPAPRPDRAQAPTRDISGAVAASIAGIGHAVPLTAVVANDERISGSSENGDDDAEPDPPSPKSRGSAIIAPAFLLQVANGVAPPHRSDSISLLPARISGPARGNPQPIIASAAPLGVDEIGAEIGAETSTSPSFGMPAPRLETGVVPVATDPAIVFDRHLDLSRETLWLDRLARDIAMTADGTGKLRFELAPPALGRLEVALDRSVDGLHVHLTTQTEPARAIIADAQPRLETALKSEGVRIAETQVSSDAARNQSGAGHNAPRPALIEAVRDDRPEQKSSAVTPDGQFA